MLKIKSKQIWLLTGDVFLLILALYLTLFLRNLYPPTREIFLIHFDIFFPLFLILLTLYYSFNLYDFLPFQNKLKQITQIVNNYILLLAIGFIYFYIFSSVILIAPKTFFVLYVLIGSVLAIIWRLFIVPSFFRPLSKMKTLLIADGDEYNELREMVNTHDFYPFYFVDHLDVKEDRLGTEEDAIDDLKKIFSENRITQVVVDIRDPRTNIILPFLYNLASQRKITVFDAANVYQDILKKMPMRGIGHFWFFESVRLNIQAYEIAKRVIDIILTMPLIIFWMMLHPFVCLAIKLDGKGDVFITHERYGLGGKIIRILKYRTMTFSDEGVWLKEKNNPNKVTRVGYWLRKTRIDELPQLLAVLKGDLSFVGPRPDMLKLGGVLSANIPYYMMRYTVRPGLSGWAQVNQSLPPQSIEENKIRTQYDLYYVKNRSLLLDFIVMVKTFRVLLSRSGM